MRDRIRNAFDKIQAEPELKQRTARFLAEKILQQPARKKVPPLRRVALLCTVLAVFLLGAGFFHSYYTVSAAISIDGASSLELEINCFDRVISVTGYGSSSQSLADSLEVKHQNYRQAVETIREFLENGELLILTVPVRTRNRAMKFSRKWNRIRQKKKISAARPETRRKPRPPGRPDSLWENTGPTWSFWNWILTSRPGMSRLLPCGKSEIGSRSWAEVKTGGEADTDTAAAAKIPSEAPASPAVPQPAAVPAPRHGRPFRR